MAMRILWPNLPAPLVPVATEAVGPGFETVFREKFDEVTDDGMGQRGRRRRRLPAAIHR